MPIHIYTYADDVGLAVYINALTMYKKSTLDFNLV
jgi:hypothetical protein